MERGGHITFRRFRFDPVSERLWRGARAISLRPKTFAVLRFLVEHAGQLVTKEALLDAVWPGTSVSDIVPIVCVRELRQALGDQADAPHFIETVPRRGYRFIAPIAAAPPVKRSTFNVQRLTPKVRGLQSAIRSPQSAIGMVGREAELAQLHKWLEKAVSGERRVVFVTGEPGIGKTAVVETFLESLESKEGLESSLQSLASEKVRGLRSKVQGPNSDPTPHPHSPTPVPWIACGQCLEHYGAGEAYMPVLDALGRLCRGPGGKRLIEILARLAPTWLAQMPSLIGAPDWEVLQRQILGATRERMLREMAEAVEAVTAEKPLILVLEDLHWSDHSTLDLVSSLAQRQEPARLLLIGTYRPAALHLNPQPLKAIKRELQVHRRCEELPLQLLSEAMVGEYLAQRFTGELPPTPSLQKLSQLIYQRTDGNPLFVVNMVDYLVAQRGIVTGDNQGELTVNLPATEVGVPASLGQMIETQIDGLPAEEQRVLEAASVAGGEFSAAAVAAALGKEVAQSEEWCAELTRGERFLRACGIDEWPDGTVAGRYTFIHTLYQQVLYQRLTDGQRLHLHRRIGERKETGYGQRAGEIAGELAGHFAQGRDYRRAVQYLRQAAQHALRRDAFQEALGHFTKGLELLKNLADTPEHSQQELLLHMAVADTEAYFLNAIDIARQQQAKSSELRAVVGLGRLWQQQGKKAEAQHLLAEIYNWFSEGVDTPDLQEARALLQELGS